MTVSSTVNKAGPYTGDGTTTVFPFNFGIKQDSDIQVIVADTSGVESTIDPSLYSVSGAGGTSGSVTYPLTGSPLATGYKLVILRNMTFEQTTDITNQGGFYPDVIEDVFDKTVMMIQQLDEQLSRAVKVTSTDTTTPDELITEIKNDAAQVASDATQVASDKSDVDTKYSSISPHFDNIDTVAGISADVSTVAGIEADVSTVAGISADVSTVAANDADISTVAANDANITTVAENITDVTNFADVYQGPKASDPATRNDGSALQQGDLYFNTSTKLMKVYDGTSWNDASSAVKVLQAHQYYTAGTASGSYTGSLSTFPITYDVGYVDVFVNGTKLFNSDFTATDGMNVVLSSDATAGDDVELIAYTTFSAGAVGDGNVSRSSLGTATYATQAEAEAATDNGGVMTPLRTGQAIAKNGFGGSAQTWQDVTASRAGSTTYTNSTGKPIEVAIIGVLNGSSALNGFILTIGSISYTQTIYGNGSYTKLGAVIPDGETYSFTVGIGGSGTPSLHQWFELR